MQAVTAWHRSRDGVPNRDESTFSRLRSSPANVSRRAHTQDVTVPLWLFWAAIFDLAAFVVVDPNPGQVPWLVLHMLLLRAIARESEAARYALIIFTGASLALATAFYAAEVAGVLGMSTGANLGALLLTSASLYCLSLRSTEPPWRRTVGADDEQPAPVHG